WPAAPSRSGARSGGPSHRAAAGRTHGGPVRPGIRRSRHTPAEAHLGLEWLPSPGGPRYRHAVQHLGFDNGLRARPPHRQRPARRGPDPTACPRSLSGKRRMKTLLHMNDVHAYYGAAHILQGLSLRVDEGERVALIGRNGVGKTTTVNTLMGL